MPFNIFGKKEKPVSSEDAIGKLRDTEEMLGKKSTHLESLINNELVEAKKAGTKNKRVALNHLKKKKRLELQLQQVDNTLTTIEFQREALMNAKANTDVLNSMKTASSAMKQIHKDNNIDNVEDVMADIQEQQDVAAEISDAISRPIDVPGLDMDDDDLLAELDELEQEQIDNEMLQVNSVIPTNLPNVPTTSLPTTSNTEQVASSSNKVSDEADLAELNAWIES